MINQLFVPKPSNTYADTFLLLGLAQIAEDALHRTGQNPTIQLIDKGTHACIQFAHAINLETITKLDYTNPFPPVRGQKTDWTSMPTETTYFDVVKEVEKRKLYRDYRYQNGGKTQWTEESPKPPDPRSKNGAILTSVAMGCEYSTRQIKNKNRHNELWLKSWYLKQNYGNLVAGLLHSFSNPNSLTISEKIQQVADWFQEQTGNQLPAQEGAVKIYLPTAVQGVSRIKANGNKFTDSETDWLSLWLITNGLFQFALAEQIKIGKQRNYEWRVIALEPKEITFEKYREILSNLRQFNPPGGGHGIARFDAELVLKFCQQLLENHQAKAQDRPEDPFDFLGKPVNDFIGSFRGTHFGSKGQVYGVKELFTLGLPGWIIPDNYQDLLAYLEVLQEHLAVIVSLSAEEGQSEILAAYRDFITGTNLRNFFRFQVSYADFVVKRLADSQARSPRLFSVNGLNIMTKKDADFTKITQDPSFLRIAKAINQATVYAGKITTKEGVKELDWQRNYGLAQLLSTQSGSKKDFISAIADFLGKYQQENLRLQEGYLKQGKRLMRVQPTKEDLDRLIEIIHEFDTVLVANLLIAYGYAKWSKSKDELPTETDTTNDNTDEPEEP